MGAGLPAGRCVAPSTRSRRGEPKFIRWLLRGSPTGPRQGRERRHSSHCVRPSPSLGQSRALGVAALSLHAHMPEPSHPMETAYFRQNFSSSLTSSLLYTNFSDEKSRTRPGRGSARAVAALTVTCVFASPLAPPLHHRLHPVSRTYTMFRQALSTSARPAARSAALQRGTAAQARFASGGSSYNQPTGYLFGEKVRSSNARHLMESGPRSRSARARHHD